MKGLLIEFDLKTGKRAGGINPRDPGLVCYGWQNIDTDPAVEIRLIADNRDTTQYEGVDGITVLNNDTEIDNAIDTHIPSTYSMINPLFVIESMKEKNIQFSTLKNKDMKTILSELHGKGVAGIVEIKPAKTNNIKKI